MKRFRIVHTTKYSFSDTVSCCKGEAHLEPRLQPHQHCEFHQLVIRPLADVQRQKVDPFGNHVVYFEVHEPHMTLEVTGVSTVRIDLADGMNLEASTPWNKVADTLENDNRLSKMRQFVANSQFIERDAVPADYARISFTKGRPVLSAARDLMQRIHADFVYDPGSTTVSTSVNEVFKNRRGVCQDFANVAICCLRSLGLAARYVSGYLYTAESRGARHAMASDATHAWFSVYDPDMGWVDFDAADGSMPADNHVTTGWGRDYRDVAPLKGLITGGGSNRLKVSVDVEKLDDGQGDR